MERFALEARLPPDDLRAPPDDARLDGVRLLLEAAVRGRALAPFALEPPREDAERAPERPPLEERLLLAAERLLLDAERPLLGEPLF